MGKQNEALKRIQNGSPHAKRSRWISFTDIVSDVGKVLCRSRREAELHCSKRRNAASISASVANWRRLACARPSSTAGRWRGVYFLRFPFVPGQGQHGERDVILTVRRQPPDRFQGLFEQLGHERNIRSRRQEWKGVRKCPIVRGVWTTHPAPAPLPHCRPRSAPASPRPCRARRRYGRSDCIRPCRRDSRCPSRCDRGRTRRSDRRAGDR